MNTGAFGENFPYSNFHDLNMDWIISIVKDFLDKNANIEELINTGIENIGSTTEESVETLENTTSDSITALENKETNILTELETELDNAMSAFNTNATTRAQQALSTIPSDYSDFYNNSLVYRGSLVDGSDLNTVQTIGIWGVSSGRTYSNKPSDISSGFLVCIKYQDNFNIQIILQFNGDTVYSRQNINGTWSAWEVFNNTHVYSGIGLLANNSNLNDCKVGSVWGLGSERTYSNKPSGVSSGILITFRFDNSTTIKMQYILSFTEGIWTRYYISSWTAWSKIDTPNAIENFERLANDTDLNSITTDSIYSLGSERTYYNSPITESGWLFTLVFQSNVFTQIAMSLNGQEIYIRYYLIDHWVNWFSQSRHNAQNHYYAFGDSIVWGQTTDGAQSPYNYPAQVGLALQMRTHNYAERGQGLLKDWTAIHTNYINGLDMSNAKLITIGWAYNDQQLYSSIPFGNANSTDSTTLIGHYYTIMKEFQQKCPLAKIVLITGYGYPNGTINPVTKPTLTDQFTHEYTFSDGNKSVATMYDTLEEMCNKNGWSCINQHKGTTLNQFNANTVFLDQIHLVNDGYYLYGQYISGQMTSMYGNTSI